MQVRIAGIAPRALALGLAAAAALGCAVSAAGLADGGLSVRTIDLGPLRVTDGHGGIVAADLTGDGRPELLVTAPKAIGAYSVSGAGLWHVDADIRLSKKAEDEGLPGYHAPGVTVTEVEGRRLVLYLDRDSRLIALDAATGRQTAAVRLVPPTGAKGWEHLAVASFRGKGTPDLLLQATDHGYYYKLGRHLAAWPLDKLLRDGAGTAPLWRRDDFLALPHSGARIADLDGDGRHEVIGGMVLRPDGSVAVTFPVPAKHMNHLDGVYVADVLPERPGLEVVALEEKEENRVLLAGLDGLIWSGHHNHVEAQNAIVGDFDPARPGLEIWARSRFDTDQQPFVFDSRGKVIANYRLRETAPRDWTVWGVEEISAIHWTGDGRQHAAAKARHTEGDVAIFDPMTGRFLLRIPEQAQRLYVADVMGDWREEVIVVSEDQIRIYGNPAPNPNPGRPRLWEDDAYRQAKTVWNYYTP